QHHVNAARPHRVALNQHRTGVVVNLQAIMAAGPLHRVVDETYAVDALAKIFEVQLIEVATRIVADTGAAAVGTARPGVVDIEVFDRDAGHGPPRSLEGDPLLGGVAAFEVIENQVLGGRSERIDAIPVVASLVQHRPSTAVT